MDIQLRTASGVKRARILHLERTAEGRALGRSREREARRKSAMIASPRNLSTVPRSVTAGTRHSKHSLIRSRAWSGSSIGQGSEAHDVGDNDRHAPALPSRFGALAPGRSKGEMAGAGPVDPAILRSILTSSRADPVAVRVACDQALLYGPHDELVPAPVEQRLITRTCYV